MSSKAITSAVGVADNLGRIVQAAVDEAIRRRGQMTVLIAGRTGVGKSTLVNAVFQGNMAETGQGRPVTKTTREIKKEGVPLAIWDTRGLEMEAFRETIGELEALVREKRADPDPHQHIHVAWLCIQEDGRRVEEAEIALHERLDDVGVPVVGVITKARSDKGFKDEVQRLMPRLRNVVRVRALAEELDDGHSLAPMGLEALIESTSEVIPDGHRRALAAAQKASLEYKKRNARAVVATASGAAGVVGASPVPFTDAALLVPTQIGMLAGISATFGLEVSRAFVSTLVASAAGATGATMIGRALVANALKFLPGAGTLVGGAISATTATALTAALGEAYIQVLAALFEETGGEPPSPEAVAAEFKRKFQSAGH